MKKPNHWDSASVVVLVVLVTADSHLLITLTGLALMFLAIMGKRESDNE